jgi:hypothetical protein
MKRQTENPRQIVARFLATMGEPVSDEQSNRATQDVLERLRDENVRPLRVVSEKKVGLRPSRSRVWGAVAATVVVTLAGGLLQMILLRSVDADVIARSVRGELLIEGKADMFPPSLRIETGKVVQAGAAGGSITLRDGSQVDMSPGAALSVVRVSDGLSVRLSTGTVLVTAAEQKNGHLYVETKDCLISVVGTVFAVNAEESGSRVSVIEGEVHVRRGEETRTVMAGEQVSTSPRLGPIPTETVKEWVAPERLALLQPEPLPPAPQNPAASGVVVRGVVKQASTGAGIPDVTVTLCPGLVPVESRTSVTNKEQQAYGAINRNKAYFFTLWDRASCSASSVTTDSNGRFQFPDTAPGEYTVTAEREGYGALPSPPSTGAEEGRRGVFRYYNAWVAGAHYSVVNDRPLAGDSKSVTVEARQSPAEISLTLIRAGVISGRVRDEDGRLLVNAPVRIVQGATADGLVIASATTNDRGEYRAYWLLPGEYRVIASGPAGRSFSETWFPRGANAAEGNSVTVREGEEVSNIDIILRPSSPDAPPVQPPVRWNIRP